MGTAMTFELFPYQNQGADFLAGRRRALLLDAPGLGKTAQAIYGAERRGADLVETICPAAVVTQWRRNHADITLSDNTLISRSYESARDKGISQRPDVLVLDELHYLQNPISGRTTRILGSEVYGTDGLINRAGAVWGLSGSPNPRDPSNLFPAMNAIIPGSLALKNGHLMDYWQFMRKFCVMYDSGYGMVVKAGKNLDELRDRLNPYVLRRTKSEVLPEWKEPITSELWLDPEEASDMLSRADLEPEAQAVADAFKKHGFEGLKVLAQADKNGISRYRRYVGMLKVLPVVKWLMEELENQQKIVVIAVHREVLEGISAKLNEQKIGNVIYYGGMTEKQKEAAKKSFINDPKIRVFEGQIVAAGTGLDGLQAATGRMLFAEWSWIGDENWQALCRLDRIEQNEPVLGQFAGFESSLDGSIMKAAARRTKESKQLFG